MEGEKKMDEDYGGVGAFLSGFLMGALVGGAVALLFAPQSGEETRLIIKDKSIEIKDKSSEKAGEYAQKTKESAASLQQRGQVVLEEQKARLSKKESEADYSEAIELSDEVVEEVAPEPEDASEA
jgi:gas vesicle protein